MVSRAIQAREQEQRPPFGFCILLTKADKVDPAVLQQRVTQTQEEATRLLGQAVEVRATSATTKTGVEEAWGTILAALPYKGVLPAHAVHAQLCSP
jgi:GTP-binding protein EngB required for normal cell division